MKSKTNLALCFLALFLSEQSNAGSFIVNTQKSFDFREMINVEQNEFNEDCYNPGDAVRTEEQTFVVPEQSRVFAFASLCIQCAPEINGSIHRVPLVSVL